jgi:malate dehydrogenase
MTTVCILGAGDTGSATARALAANETAGCVVLVDPVRGAAAGKALDLQQAEAITGTHVALSGTDDWSRLTGASVCVVADPASVPGEWSPADTTTLLDCLTAYAGDAPLVFATAGQAPALLTGVHRRGLARERLMGSAPQAFAASLRAIVALEAQCSPSEVMLAVLGAPPAAVVVPWSEATIGGRAIDRVLSTAQIGRVQARAARLWPPGAGALGMAAAGVAAGLIRSSRRTFIVSAILDGEFGVRDRVAIVPARLSPHGIARIEVPRLDTRERVQVETALDA